MAKKLCGALLAIVDISAVQSCALTFIHNAILFVDTSNNARLNHAHWLIGTPYLSTIASNGFDTALRHQYHWVLTTVDIVSVLVSVSVNAQ